MRSLLTVRLGTGYLDHRSSVVRGHDDDTVVIGNDKVARRHLDATAHHRHPVRHDFRAPLRVVRRDTVCPDRKSLFAQLPHIAHRSVEHRANRTLGKPDRRAPRTGRPPPQ